MAPAYFGSCSEQRETEIVQGMLVRDVSGRGEPPDTRASSACRSHPCVCATCAVLSDLHTFNLCQAVALACEEFRSRAARSSGPEPADLHSELGGRSVTPALLSGIGTKHVNK